MNINVLNLHKLSEFAPQDRSYNIKKLIFQ